MSLHDYSVLLCTQLTEEQLFERMTALRQCIHEAKAEAVAACEQSREKARFDELYEPYKRGKPGGAWQTDKAVMAAYDAEREFERAAYAKTNRLRDDYGRVYTAWDDRRRTCGRCWEIKPHPGMRRVRVQRACPTTPTV